MLTMQELDGCIVLLWYLSEDVAMSDTKPTSDNPDAADIAVDAMLEKLLAIKLRAIKAAHGGNTHA